MSAPEQLRPGPMTDLTAPYYAALADWRLVVQRCNDCQALIMYPKYRCPGCGSADLGWATSAGVGTLHSFTVLRLGAPSGYEDDLPYAMGVVKLDEGVQLLGRLHPGADGTWAHYRCDGRVRFRPIDVAQATARPTAWFEAG